MANKFRKSSQCFLRAHEPALISSSIKPDIFKLSRIAGKSSAMYPVNNTAAATRSSASFSALIFSSCCFRRSSWERNFFRFNAFFFMLAPRAYLFIIRWKRKIGDKIYLSKRRSHQKGSRCERKIEYLLFSASPLFFCQSFLFRFLGGA